MHTQINHTADDTSMSIAHISVMCSDVNHMTFAQHKANHSIFFAMPFAET